MTYVLVATATATATATALVSVSVYHFRPLRRVVFSPLADALGALRSAQSRQDLSR